MKILSGILVALTLLGLVAGCQQKTMEVTYKELSLGSMSSSIPTQWQRPEGIEEYVGDLKSAIGSGMEQYVQVDLYEVPKSEDLALILAVVEMSNIIESEGKTWEGWESVLEAQGMTREDFPAMFLGGFISEGVEEATEQQKLQHTIHGCEAVEVQATGKIEGEPTLADLLVVFAGNDLGVVMMLVHESASEEYEDSWQKIRDSVQF